MGVSLLDYLIILSVPVTFFGILVLIFLIESSAFLCFFKAITLASLSVSKICPGVYENLLASSLAFTSSSSVMFSRTIFQKIEDENFDKNQIAEVFMKGYKRGDKVIRYTVVKVAN